VVKRRRSETVRLPRELAEDLRAEAARLGYPFPWLMARILREWLMDPPASLTLVRRPDDEGDDDGG
jgi:hypothetical protein